MKLYAHIAAYCLLALSAMSAAAQDCDLTIAYADVSQGENVPEAINSKLQAKITGLLARDGISSDSPDSRFFVTARFDHGYSEMVDAGASHQYMLKTDLTLYFGDSETRKIYASKVLSLKGLGDSEERAYIKCLNGLNINNKSLQDFIREGRDKIVEYYDANYPSIIAQARAAMAQRNYGEALYYSTSIPECSRGFDQAQAVTMQCYAQHRDYESQQLLAKAKAAWAESPDANGAAEANRYLTRIDPASSGASAAAALSKEMTQTTKRQWEFENVQKYKDELQLEKQRIASATEIRKENIRAAKAIAVAYAKSRPRVVHHYNWIRW